MQKSSNKLRNLQKLNVVIIELLAEYFADWLSYPMCLEVLFS